MYTMTSGRLTAAFGDTPSLVSVSRTDAAGRLPGNPAGLPAEFTVYDPVTRKIETLTGEDIRFRGEAADDRTYVWRADAPGGLSADIEARFADSRITFTLKNVRETENRHLVTVRLNGLAAAVQTDPCARMALPAHGGRLLDPASVKDGRRDHRYNWILDSFGGCAVVYTGCLTAVIRAGTPDDWLTSLVGGPDGERYAQSGALLRRRYTRYDVSYRKAKDPDSVETPENEEFYGCAEDFLLPGDPFVTIDLIAHEAVKPESGWTVGAKAVRDSLPDKPYDGYRGKMIYKIFVGAPGQPVRTGLDDVRAIIEKVAARTGNAGQVAYLVGFQHEGHDSKYPDVSTLNPALGSVEALKKLAEDAEKLNCRLSFHDNYDDAYRNSPSWDAEDISRDSTGHLLRGGIWNGVQAYWNSMPEYADKKAGERVRRTLERYPFLKETYHLDVLTASVFRVDFRKDRPTGRQADLEARKKIVRLFREKGLDVSSEACGLPFIGTIAYFWHMQRVPREFYENDRRIPMVPFLAHGKADYAGSHTDSLWGILDGLLYGGFYCNDVTPETPAAELTDARFMLLEPLDRIRDSLAVSYTEENGRKTITYDTGAEISVCFETGECRVTIGGVRYIENGTAMIPREDGSTILYRCAEEPYSDVRWKTGYPAGTKLIGRALGTDDPDREWTVETDGCIPVDTELHVAFRVTEKEIE